MKRRSESLRADSDIRDAVKERLQAIRSLAPTATEEIRQARVRIEEALSEYWREPLDLLELFIQAVTEAEIGFIGSFHDDAVASKDEVHNALTRLLGRGCLVARATLTLLRGGYADDAHARRRTLHELAVTATVISANGQELAERYMLHAAIERQKLASDLQKFQSFSGVNTIPPEDFENIQAERGRLVQRFGKSFGKDFGWAACLFDGTAPTMWDIEERIGFHHLRVLYRLSSHNVHANAQGTIYKLGLSLYPGEAHLVAPSIMGLDIAGQSRAMSLFLIALALLNTKPTEDNQIAMGVLKQLTMEVGEAFGLASADLAASVKVETTWLQTAVPFERRLTYANVG